MGYEFGTRKFALDFLGEKWKECFLEFRPFVYSELSKIAELGVEIDDPIQSINSTKAIVDLLKQKFVAGYAINETGKVEVKRESIDDFPVEIIKKAILFLSGADEKND